MARLLLNSHSERRKSIFKILVSKSGGIKKTGGNYDVK